MADRFTLNRAAPQALDLLLSRRSGSAKAMTGPGPSPVEIERILAAGARVPDHGKLAPWRFIIIDGDARGHLGQACAERLRQIEPAANQNRIEFEQARFLRAPIVIAVVSRARPGLPIPEWEQILSAGASCQNMLIAAHALGYVGNWVTDWCAYDRSIMETLGLDESERIAGFIYFGRPMVPLEERVRPDMKSLISHFQG